MNFQKWELYSGSPGSNCNNNNNNNKSMKLEEQTLKGAKNVTVAKFVLVLTRYQHNLKTTENSTVTDSVQSLQEFDAIDVYLKGTGSRNRKQTCYLYNLYCCPHVAIVFCTDSGGWGESTTKLLQKIYQYLCNHTTYECFVCFSSKLKTVHLQNKTFILRKTVENLCDMAYQKYFKIVILKEVCLHYVTLPL